MDLQPYLIRHGQTGPIPVRPPAVRRCFSAQTQISLRHANGPLQLAEVSVADALFGAAEPVGQTVRVQMTPLLVVGAARNYLVVRHHHYGKARTVELREKVHYLRSRESSAPVGSSARISAGPLASARAIATRCCWPPESSAGVWSIRALRPTASNSERALASIAMNCFSDHIETPCNIMAQCADRVAPCRYSFRNFRISSKNWNRGFSNNTKCVAFGISTLFFIGACTRSRISPSRSSGKDQVSKAPAITSVGA